MLDCTAVVTAVVDAVVGTVEVGGAGGPGPSDMTSFTRDPDAERSRRDQGLS